MDASPAPEPVSGLLVDGPRQGRPRRPRRRRPAGRVAASRNTTERTSADRSITWEAWPTDAKDWRAAVAADLDLDTWADLVGLPASGDAPSLALGPERRQAARRRVRSRSRPATAEPAGVDGFALADLVGDPLPDLVLVGDGDAPGSRATSATAGTGWRSTSAAAGRPASTTCGPTRTGSAPGSTLEGQGLHVPYDHTTTQAGPRRSRSGRSSSGSAERPRPPLLRLRWPDGTMQCELNVAADQTLALDREQPQDRQLPRPLHLERRPVRLPRRLPRRRRARLPRRPRRLRPARPRRGRRHRPRPAPAGRRHLPPRRSPSRWTRSPTSTS